MNTKSIFILNILILFRIVIILIIEIICSSRNSSTFIDSFQLAVFIDRIISIDLINFHSFQTIIFIDFLLLYLDYVSLNFINEDFTISLLSLNLLS